MPPHCDSLDGPVVRAARRALEAGNVDHVLPFVTEAAEAEVNREFDAVMKARGEGPASRAVADRHFFETVVRLHRSGEGAPYTGVKPAGLDVGPIIPIAEHAIESGEAGELLDALYATIRRQVANRFARLEQLKEGSTGTVPERRAYVTEMLRLQVWAHGVYSAAISEPHGERVTAEGVGAPRH